MKIKTQQKGNMIIAQFSGELDHHSASDAKNQLDNLLKDTSINEILLDFKNLRFMDSSGIGVVIGRYKILKNRNGNMYVTNVSRQIDKIFQLSGLYKIIKKI